MRTKLRLESTAVATLAVLVGVLNRELVIALVVFVLAYVRLNMSSSEFDEKLASMNEESILNKDVVHMASRSYRKQLEEQKEQGVAIGAKLSQLQAQNDTELTTKDEQFRDSIEEMERTSVGVIGEKVRESTMRTLASVPKLDTIDTSEAKVLSLESQMTQSEMSVQDLTRKLQSRKSAFVTMDPESMKQYIDNEFKTIYRSLYRTSERIAKIEPAAV